MSSSNAMIKLAKVPRDGVFDLGDALLKMVRTRLQLLSVELAEERTILVAQLRLGIICWSAGMLTAIALIIWLAVTLPPDVRGWVLASFVVVLAAVTAWVARLVKTQQQEFGQALRRFGEQMKRDGEVLSEALSQKKA